jgi:hypothetical protein
MDVIQRNGCGQTGEQQLYKEMDGESHNVNKCLQPPAWWTEHNLPSKAKFFILLIAKYP